MRHALGDMHTVVSRGILQTFPGTGAHGRLSFSLPFILSGERLSAPGLFKDPCRVNKAKCSGLSSKWFGTIGNIAYSGMHLDGLLHGDEGDAPPTMTAGFAFSGQGPTGCAPIRTEVCGAYASV